MGRFTLGLFGLLAELERAIIVERVKAGVKEAQRQGKHCGRPSKIFDRDRARALRKKGMSWRKISKEMNLPLLGYTPLVRPLGVMPDIVF